MEHEGEVTIIADLEFVIDNSDLEDLRLRPPAGGNKHSADVMDKTPGRPAIGVQGMILDAMTDGRITTAEASALLRKLNARLSGGLEGMGKVTDDGSVVPLEAITNGG